MALTSLELRIVVVKLVDHEGGEAVADEVEVAVPVPPRRDCVQPEGGGRGSDVGDAGGAAGTWCGDEAATDVHGSKTL